MVDNGVMSHPVVQKHLRETMDPVDYAAIDVPGIVLHGRDAVTNPAKYGVKWVWLKTDPDPLTLEASVGANGIANAFVERPGTQGGDIEFLGVGCRADDRFAVQIESQSLNLQLCNRPVCSSLVFGRGTAGSPFRTSFYEPGTGALKFFTSNLVAAENDIELSPFGRRFIGQEAQDSIEARRAKFLGTRINPFFAGPDGDVTFGDVEFVIAAGGTLDLQSTLPSVGDFLCISMRDDSTIDSGPNIGKRADLSVQITDGLTGYHLMDDPVHMDLVAARSLSFIDAMLPAPSFEGSQLGVFSHLFARSSKILTHIVNNDPDHTATVRFLYEGVILRYAPAPNRNTNTSVQNREEMLRRALPAPYRNIVEGGRS